MEKIELIEHYKIHIDLYKHYLELLIKFNFFYYAITGAILSFYFAHKTIIFIQFTLLFPLIMSILFSVFFFYASSIAKNSSQVMIDVVRELGLKVSPELKILVILLRLFAVLFILISILLLLLFLFHKLLLESSLKI